MKKGICPDCKQIKLLGKHSKTGNHQPPYIWICRTCHNKRHGMKERKQNINKKYVRGTPRQHKKKKFWKI